MKIDCPHCGARDISEFKYLGDATVTRPADPDTASHDDWMAYVYYRDNPKGRHQEYWHHGSGCRQWLKVTRDTVTHEIFAVVPAAGGEA